MLRNVKATNAQGETTFADLDHISSQSRNKKLRSINSQVMWRRNKTHEYLAGLSDNDRDSLLSFAKAEGPALRERWRVRDEVVRKRKLEMMEEDMRKAESKQDEQMKAKEEHVDKANECPNGVWHDEASALVGLGMCDDVGFSKIQALQAQLLLRSVVFDQDVGGGVTVRKTMKSKKNDAQHEEILRNRLFECLATYGGRLGRGRSLLSDSLIGRKVSCKYVDAGSGETTADVGKIWSRIQGTNFYQVYFKEFTEQNGSGYYAYDITEGLKNHDLELLE